MVRIRNGYCLAFCWMALFSLRKTLSCFGCKSIRLCFSGHVFKWIKPSLPSYSVSGLCNQASLASPGPPAAPAAHKHYKWESTNILYLVLNYLSTEKVKHWQTEFCETFLHLQTTNSPFFFSCCVWTIKWDPLLWSDRTCAGGNWSHLGFPRFRNILLIARELPTKSQPRLWLFRTAFPRHWLRSCCYIAQRRCLITSLCQTSAVLHPFCNELVTWEVAATNQNQIFWGALSPQPKMSFKGLQPRPLSRNRRPLR